jgi:hypothetical protein
VIAGNLLMARPSHAGCRKLQGGTRMPVESMSSIRIANRGPLPTHVLNPQCSQSPTVHPTIATDQQDRINTRPDSDGPNKLPTSATSQMLHFLSQLSWHSHLLFIRDCCKRTHPRITAHALPTRRWIGIVTSIEIPRQ